MTESPILNRIHPDKSSEVSAKSRPFTDKSLTFSNVFEKVNQAYSLSNSDEGSNSSKTNKLNESNKKNNTQSEEQAEQNKPLDNDAQKADKTYQKPDENSAGNADKKNSSSDSAENADKNKFVKAEKQSNEGDKDNQKIENDSNVVKENSVNEQADEISENVINLEVSHKPAQNLQNESDTIQQASVNAALAVSQEAVNLIFEHNKQNSGDIQIQTQTQVQTQVQTQPQAQTQPQTQPQAQIQQDFSKLVSAENNQTANSAMSNPYINTSAGNSSPVPLVNADAELSALSGNTAELQVNPDAKQSVKDMLEKTTLNQEILNKTNAKVVSVQTTGTSNQETNPDNLLNKQNIEEQTIKLELENNDSGESPMQTSNANQNTIQNTSFNPTQNIDLSTITNPASHVSFAKSPDSMQLQTPKELNSNDILAQINKQITLKTLHNENGTKINIILKPENLGKISLELVNTKQGLTARMLTENPQVKEILDKNLEKLKDTLGNHGINVNNMAVKVQESQRQSNDMFLFDGKEQNTGDEESAGNARKQAQNKAQADENTNKTDLTNETDTDVLSEEAKDSGSEILYAGQIDYKV